MKPKIAQTTRIDKYLSGLGYASRRKIADFLRQHKVILNGRRVTESGERLDPHTDQLTINGQAIKTPESLYYLVNKPVGFVSTVSDEHGRPTVTSLVKTQDRLFPVGRLDIDSHGLVLLTNDGDLTFRLTHPKFKIPKTYLVTIDGAVTHKHRQQLRAGVRLKDGRTQPAQVESFFPTPGLETPGFLDDKDQTKLKITITEGRNRQIRRMCKAINLHVADLERISFGPLQLGNLEPGQSRPLTDAEILSLKKR